MVHRGELAAILTSSQGAVAKDLFARGKRVEAAAKMNLEKSPRRVDTGELKYSINTQLLSGGGKLAVRVGTNVFYAIFVHDGTGIYGPTGTPIKPKLKKVMVWTNSKGKKVFAYQVAGIEPNPFLANAVNAAKG